jgi:hypothetical protein
MKIQVKEVPEQQLPAGRHFVRITKVEEGITINGLEYFDCYFQSCYGICSKRFHVVDQCLPRIVSLFRACGIPVYSNDVLETFYLTGLSLEIENISRIIDGEIITEIVAFHYWRPEIVDED